MGKSKRDTSDESPAALPLENADPATLVELVHILTHPVQEAEATPALTAKQLATLNMMIGGDVVARAIRRAKKRIAHQQEK